MLPPLRALQTFEAVARIGGFTAAAEELNVTQSAVSHQIRNLERSLGVALIRRSGKGVLLTRQGERLFRDLTAAFDVIKRSIAEVNTAQSARPLGVLLRPHFASKWLAPRLSQFWLQNPGFDLRFFHSNDPADFTDPDIHVAIEWRHRDTLPAKAQCLIDGNLTPACRPSLIQDRETIVPADLTEHALLYERDERSWHEWLSLADVPDLRPRRREYYEDTNVRQQAAIEGEGWALVCPRLVVDDLEAGRLVCPFNIHLKTYSYYLVVPPDRRTLPKVRTFTDWISNEARGTSH